MVNNDFVGPIKPGRGLRQGGPLSPLLFIICAEGLSAMIKNYEIRGDIHGIKICSGAPTFFHLLFADDNFLFLWASEKEFLCMKKLLEDYENASGLAINYQKSEILFSRNFLQMLRILFPLSWVSSYLLVPTNI